MYTNAMVKRDRSAEDRANAEVPEHHPHARSSAPTVAGPEPLVHHDEEAPRNDPTHNPPTDRRPTTHSTATEPVHEDRFYRCLCRWGRGQCHRRAVEGQRQQRFCRQCAGQCRCDCSGCVPDSWDDALGTDVTLPHGYTTPPCIMTHNSERYCCEECWRKILESVDFDHFECSCGRLMTYEHRDRCLRTGYQGCMVHLCRRCLEAHVCERSSGSESDSPPNLPEQRLTPFMYAACQDRSYSEARDLLDDDTMMTAAPWLGRRAETPPRTITPRGSVATGHRAFTAADEPSETEEVVGHDETAAGADDTEELELQGVTRDVLELCRRMPRSKMTNSDWVMLELRTLRAPTPERYKVFPRDRDSVVAELASLKELIVGGFPGAPPRGVHEGVIWCHDTKSLSIIDLKEAFNHFSILACIRYVEKRDIEKAQRDQRDPVPYNGKLVMVHFLSSRKEHRSAREESEVMVQCDEVIYNEEGRRYNLVNPHCVRLGLLRPFVGAEIGCWLRRHRLVELALERRTEYRGDLGLERLTLRIACGAPHEALLVLCPFLCLPTADAKHITENTADKTDYTDPFLLCLFLVVFLLAVVGLHTVLSHIFAKLYKKKMKPKEKMDEYKCEYHGRGRSVAEELVRCACSVARRHNAQYCWRLVPYNYENPDPNPLCQDCALQWRNGSCICDCEACEVPEPPTPQGSKTIPR